MKWFQGSIPEAIQSSKAKKSVFIVYVYGEDELSQQMSKTWEDEEVTKICEANKVVAVRIAGNSEACGFFSQIYPVIVMPSSFFIGEGGVPLEVTGGHSEPTEFLKKIERVLQDHKRQLQNAVGDGAQAALPETGASNSQTSVETKEELSSTSSDSQDLSDKVEKAKRLIEEKRKEKLQAEEEKARQAEKERRLLGQELQQLRENQKEQELKELQEQFKKEKQEERKAKERVREQIAKDREERAARFKKEKEEREKSHVANKQSHAQKQQEAMAKEEAKKRETARIQVRLPDGSSISQTFPSGEPLQSLCDFVSQQIGSYPTLSTTFPKRVFTEEDMSVSFLDLQLVPSAVVIAIPTRQSRSPGISSDSTGGVFSLFLTPIMMLWNMLFYLYCLIFGGGSGSSRRNPSPKESSSTSPQTSQEFGSKGRVDSNPESTRQARQRGNTHRLTDIKDDDDENATWNGNSTQQL
ncbi:hypothetical protein ACJMK2_022456 [Sinanodonta woodiana]|uniref:UBX domain-containing protein 4 n=2 Tax=Sinanodonta woodiana TaxID=1069815 RepID=A0ABD3TKH3_SINWO